MDVMKINSKITLLLIGLIINALLHAATGAIQVSHAQASFGIGDLVNHEGSESDFVTMSISTVNDLAPGIYTEPPAPSSSPGLIWHADRGGEW
jgi:hypothetical protein